MQVTLTALGFLAGFAVGGIVLRLLIRQAGRRWLSSRSDALNVMGNIAFWGMLVGGLVLALQSLAATAVGDVVAAAAATAPRIIAAIFTLVVGHLLGVAVQDAGSRAARAMPSVSETFLGRALYLTTIFIAVVVAMGLVGIDVSWLMNGIFGLLIITLGSFGVALAVGSIGTVQDLLAIRNLRQRLENGQLISAGEVSGRIIEFTDVSLVLETEQGIVFLPGRYLATRPVHVRAETDA